MIGPMIGPMIVPLFFLVVGVIMLIGAIGDGDSGGIFFWLIWIGIFVSGLVQILIGGDTERSGGGGGGGGCGGGGGGCGGCGGGD